jgi:hypothetical protein
LKTAIVVPEVYGLVEMQSVISLLEDKCGARVVSADAASKITTIIFRNTHMVSKLDGADGGLIAGEIPNESANPRIVKVAFSLLPEGPKDRASKMGDNGTQL